MTRQRLREKREGEETENPSTVSFVVTRVVNPCCVREVTAKGSPPGAVRVGKAESSTCTREYTHLLPGSQHTGSSCAVAGEEGLY